MKRNRTGWVLGMLAPLWAAGLATGAPQSPATMAQVEEVASFDQLVSEYDTSVTEWRRAIREAGDASARRALRKANPAIAYWARFEALHAGGEGRATMWLVQNVSKADFDRNDRPAVLIPLYDDLLAKQLEQSWFPEVVPLMKRDKRFLGDERYISMITQVAERAKARPTKAAGMLALGKLLIAQSSDDAAVERGRQLLEQLVAEFEGTEAASEAHTKLSAANLKPGKVAPDFVGNTIDGQEFKLSDYRGKVVLLDFYGFW